MTSLFNTTSSKLTQILSLLHRFRLDRFHAFITLKHCGYQCFMWYLKQCIMKGMLF
jgi:hypothetical protein